jgi:hypothetical protein
VRFNRDIRPVLSDKCFHCHGPDAATREADLRLDDPASALAERDGYRVIVPGDLEASELYRRITSTDEYERMPPVDSGRTLTAAQRALLKQWIEQGAEYQPHWSFVTPARPPLPEVAKTEWPRSAIDYFVLARLEREGLAPSPEAERHTLIRRVTLDLTGLPPTPEEVQAFLADPSPDAYEALVDRLLASPRYGEHMAVNWLDAARYADTHGYLFDTARSMWRWRDWVIGAFNRNLPFDQFTVEQLAGDLLENPTLDQLIATGFNRNHIINNEAGATPEEYFVENILDRINTTATVWMGLTMACAQCHDHKYDPVSQREYYELYAFFNNVPEVGLDGFNANAKPLMPAPTADQQHRLDALQHKLTAAEEAFAPQASRLGPAQAEWEQEFARPVEPVSEGLVAYVPLDQKDKDAVESEGTASAIFKEGTPVHEPGLFGEAISLDGQRFVELENIGDFDISDPFTLSAWIYPTSIEGRRSVFSRMEPPEVSFRGYTLQMIEGMAALILVHEFPENILQAQAKSPVEPHQWHHVLATYDGSGKVAGVRLYVDGVLQETDITIDKLSKSFRTEKPLLVGNGYPVAKFRGRIDEVRVFNRALSADEVSRLPGLSIHTLLAVKADSRTEEQQERIRNYFLDHAAPAEVREPYRLMVELREAKKELDRNLPTVMVMQEQEKPRETHVLIRGAYNRPGETVTADTPAFLPPMDEALPRNRLGLARWLIDPAHPLTARVTVNRFWQMHFGAGLVETAENFGLQGDWPSHPDLLDWLAAEFVTSGWNVKRLHRLIVTSATYRQSSQVTRRLREVDPENRLLARGPRHRLPAETIRDQALFVSGLLVERQGGPSVKPYQPAGLWKEVAFDTTGKALTAQIYEQDEGAALYRRSMYIFWKRNAPPPTMLIFDGPDRERCVVRRDRTNTPLQALVLMNDPTYVEASRKLAERMMTEAGPTAAARIARGFQLVLGRSPSQAELAPLEALWDEQVARFADDAGAAKTLLEVGASPRNETLPLEQLAAFTVIANILLNLDETITNN